MATFGAHKSEFSTNKQSEDKKQWRSMSIFAEQPYVQRQLDSKRQHKKYMRKKCSNDDLDSDSDSKESSNKSFESEVKTISHKRAKNAMKMNKKPFRKCFVLLYDIKQFPPPDSISQVKSLLDYKAEDDFTSIDKTNELKREEKFVVKKDSDKGTDSDSEKGSDKDTDSDYEKDSDKGTDSDSEKDSDKGTDSDSEKGSDKDTDSDYEESREYGRNRKNRRNRKEYEASMTPFQKMVEKNRKEKLAFLKSLEMDQIKAGFSKSLQDVKMSRRKPRRKYTRKIYTSVLRKSTRKRDSIDYSEDSIFAKVWGQNVRRLEIREVKGSRQSGRLAEKSYDFSEKGLFPKELLEATE